MAPLLLVLGVAASAHNPPGERVFRPFVRDGALAGAWTSAGVITRGDDGGWARLCGAAVDGAQDVWLRPDGALLVATRDGLVRAPDSGCGWDEVPVVPGSATRVFDLGQGDLVAVVDPDGDGDALWASTDDGDTFGPLGALPSPSTAQQMARAADGAWWVSGYHRAGGPFVARSDDDGGVWTEVDGPDPGAFGLDLVGLGPDGDGVVVSARSAFGWARLWRSEAGGGWSMVADLPLPAFGYGCAGDGCIATLGVTAVTWDRADTDDADLAILDLVDGPATCVVADPGAGAVWGCEEGLAPALVSVSTDGRRFAPALPLAAVTDRSCPAGTRGATACAHVGPPGTTGGPIDTGSPPADVGDPALTVEPRRGCVTGGYGPWWLGIAGLVAVAVRRRCR